jgi:hypothetical protein
MKIPKWLVGAVIILFLSSIYSEAGIHNPLPEYPNQDTTRIEMFVSSTSSTGHITPLAIDVSSGRVIYLK